MMAYDTQQGEQFGYFQLRIEHRTVSSEYKDAAVCIDGNSVLLDMF